MRSIYSWAKEAKCRQEEILQENIAKKYCTDCPVRGLCSTYAIVHEELGVWGGLGDIDRKRIYKWFPEFVEVLIELYRNEGLLENRSTDSLEDLMHVVELQQEHNDPTAQTDPYRGPTLSQSA